MPGLSRNPLLVSASTIGLTLHIVYFSTFFGMGTSIALYPTFCLALGLALQKSATLLSGITCLLHFCQFVPHGHFHMKKANIM